MSERTVLISGGSVAGPALAWWLHRYGLRPTIVERSPGLRPGGQAVDLRGPGREVADRMGLVPAIKAAGTGEKGWAFVDGTGRTRAAMSMEAFGGEGPTSELEILRGDLSEILHERTREYTEYLFDDRIAAIDDSGDRARVRFAGGAEREFDLVVGADGIGSSTRRMVFGDSSVKPLGLYMAYFTIPRTPTDDDWARIYMVPGGRMVTLRPDCHGTTRVLLSFDSPPRGFERLDADGQRGVLARTYADVGWEAPRVLAAMADAPDFYFESIGQVRMPAWTRGRVALVGDAGYCASPISGMGTSLALTGAYLLAGELSRTEDHRAAFAGYERVMRPFVDRAQDLPPRPRVLTDTAPGIALLHAAVRVGTSSPALALLGLLRRFGTDREEPVLPGYDRTGATTVSPATGLPGG